MPPEPQSIKEKRIRNITQLYYSRPDIQKVIFDFATNREISPRYFEGFGKRPDSLQYPGDILAMVKKGATSFHCSEELWEDPLKLTTELDKKQLDQLRIGWDLLLDIDSKYIDYSKISAELIINLLKFHGLKNIGIKFSGSKGFHIIIPFKAFPKEIYESKTSDMFPDWARILTHYITEKITPQLIDRITDLERPNQYVKDFEVPKQVMPDIILVSPRHLFRMPYSLHEKTSLASVVLDPEKISEFQLTDADAMKAKPKNFMPDVKEGEAAELLMQALDWDRETKISQGKPEEKVTGKYANFKPIKLDNLSESSFPPCIQTILKGVKDGKKRSLFVLINLLRSVGMDKEKLEKQIEDWNKKNEVPLKQGYIKSQLSWSYRKKPIMPQNCKEFYQGIGVCQPDDYCKRIKNPVNYTIGKQLRKNNIGKKKTKKFKNNP